MKRYCYAVTILLYLFPSYISADEEIIAFDIPPQTLNTALLQFSNVTGIQFLYTDEGVNRANSQGVTGRYSIHAAIAQLLNDTGYEFEFTNPDTFRVIPASPATSISTSESFIEDHETENDTSGSSRQRQNRIYEIYTTGQRRRSSQNLQSVPITITSLTADDIAIRNIDNIQQVNALLPNVSIIGGGVTGSSVGTFVIRGIPGVTRYLDGVAQPSTQGSLINVLEMERVDILKGPQGTIFGKNAMGGAIQYTTQAPRDEFGVRLQGRLGSFDRRDLIANVDIPLNSAFSTRITAAMMEKNGYVQSAVDGVRFGDERDSVLRLRSLWRITDYLQADFIASLTQSKPRYQQANILYGILEDQAPVQAYNDSGFSFTNEELAYGRLQQYKNSSSYTGPGDIWDATNYTLNIIWDFSNDIRLRSISGHREFDYGNYTDIDATHYAYFEQWRYAEGKELSQEFQLQGDFNNLTWTAGLYYGLEENLLRLIHWQYEEVNPRPRNDLIFTRRSDRAVFAEGSYRLTNNFTAALGVRYTKESFSNATYIPAEDRPAWQHITTNLTPEALIQSNSADFNAITPRLSLQYQWSSDIMTYITYSEGFNGGGVNDTPIDGKFISFEGETLKQFEIGLRSDFFERTLRLNAASFIGRWKDIQAAEVIMPGTLTTQNAGEAEVSGFEIDVLWAPKDEIIFNFSAGTLNSSYTRIGQATNITRNADLALSPQKSLSIGATYTLQLENNANISFRTDYGWTDQHVNVADIRLQAIQKSYGLLSSRIMYTAPDSSWSLAIFGTNLTDEWHQISGFSATFAGIDQGVVARPRELGLSLSVEF